MKWLANSQAVEDINSDDELVRETILSPLLPATTIDKVLEKANTDYESESQKECQDILDSIDDLIDFEDLKGRASHSSDQNHFSKNSSEEIIPQVDGSGDDLFSTHCAGSTENASEMKTIELEQSSECQELQDFGGRFNSKHKRKQPIWGSLPFSTSQKVNNDVEAVDLHVIDACVSETKDRVGTSFLAVNEAGNCADGFMINAGTDIHFLNESTALVGCSVRDLMRKKRYYRGEPRDCGPGRDKKVLLEGEQMEGIFLYPGRLSGELDKHFIESHNLKQSFTGQQTNFHCASEVKAAHSDGPMYGKRPLLSNSESLLHASKLKDGNLGSRERIGDEVGKGSCTRPVDFTGTCASQVLTGAGLCNPKNVDSAASMSHYEIISCKESGFGASTTSDERFQQPDAASSSCLLSDLVGHEVSGADCYLYESGHKDEQSLGRVDNKSYDNPVGPATDSVGLLNENCGGGKSGGHSVLSGLSSSKLKFTELIGMTFSGKPPIAGWTDGAFEDLSFLHTTSNLAEKNYDTTTGCIFSFLHGMQ